MYLFELLERLVARLTLEITNNGMDDFVLLHFGQEVGLVLNHKWKTSITSLRK